MRIISSELKNHVGKTIHLHGWLHQLRQLGKLNFLLLRDRDGLSQIIVDDATEVEKVKDLQPGSILKVQGEVVKNMEAKGGYEVVHPKIEVERAVTEAWPLDVSKPEIEANIDTILDYRPLTLRNERVSMVFKVQAKFMELYREFLTKDGFTEYFGPNIIGASSEGGSELFTVNYFDHEAKLSQSSQLYKQMMVGVNERVFALMKCFRAEPSHTSRHITEATQCEFEMGFIEDLDTILDYEERLMKFIVGRLEESFFEDGQVSQISRNKVGLFPGRAMLPEDVSIPRMTLAEAHQLYFERTGKDFRDENDMAPEEEKEMCKWAREEHGTDFVFITHFPVSKVAFYVHPNEEKPELGNYADLLCNGAEISSGGQRQHDHDKLVEQIKAKDLDPADFKDYLQIFKYGMPKHGGFGLGMERFTQMYLGLNNIREATLFPSDTKRIASVRISASKITSGEEMLAAIKKKLKAFHVVYDMFEHEPTPTSEDPARVRGVEMGTGVKALILEGKKSGDYIMVNIPADQKVDMKKVKEVVGEPCEFAKPELIKDKFGLIIGGVPPFGNILGLTNYFDESIFQKEEVNFNAGLQTVSMKMRSEDLLDVAQGVKGTFVKE